MILYLVRVVPFVQFLYHKKSVSSPEYLKTFLFVSFTQDKPLETTTLTNTMQRQTVPILGWAVGTAAWRQIAVSWNRRIRLEGDSPESGSSEYEDDEDLNDIQAGHTGQVSKVHYGVRADILHDLTPELIARYRGVSVRWHVFLGVVSSAGSAQKGKGKGRDTNPSYNSHNGVNLAASFPESGQIIQIGQDNDRDPGPSTEQPWSELGHQGHP